VSRKEEPTFIAGVSSSDAERPLGPRFFGGRVKSPSGFRPDMTVLYIHRGMRSVSRGIETYKDPIQISSCSAVHIPNLVRSITGT